MKLNKDHLDFAISELEKWAVTSTIELIKVPVFEKRIKEELKDCKDEERAKELKRALEMNKVSEKSHKESLENLELILEEVYKLR